MARQPVGCRQFLEGLIAVLEVDGSDVTTSYAKTGLDRGMHIATIKKGTGADSNLVTIKLNSPLGLAPSVLIQEITLDCVARLETAPTKQIIQIRTLELDGVTKEDDADMTVFIFGTEQIREGCY